MMTPLTFIIPVRHQDNASDWAHLMGNLTQTIRSISSQTAPGWRGVVVANEGADLPAMPLGFDVVRVTFPPNNMFDLEQGPREIVLDAFRFDKGRRVLSGMLHARNSEYFMIVDDDDLVSARLASFVTKNAGANGWLVRLGYVWDSGGRILYRHDDFNHVCGTSLIISSRLYELPERFGDATADYIKTRLGGHYGIQSLFEAKGTPLDTLPFRGAIYRVANPGSHSKARGLLKQYVFTRGRVRRPHRLARAILRLRPLTKSLKREFFGR